MNLADQLQHDHLQHATRRHFLSAGMAGLGSLYLASQTKAEDALSAYAKPDLQEPLALRSTGLPAKAKRVIFLHMAGAPSQLELFDHKPELDKLHGQDCPQEFLAGKRFAFIRGVPQLLGSLYPFEPAGQSGHCLSDRLPHLKTVVDDLCFIRTMRSDQFNHAPAQLLVHTGNRNMGYASLGAWATYGLGSENQNLPGFMVLVSGGKTPDAGKSVWGSGFLPSVYQGVQCRSEGDPVLYLSNPPGINRALRGRMLESINRVNQQAFNEVGDPETLTRISQYEMAFRMQVSASDALDMKDEPEHIHQLYGTQPGKESFANNCLLARRLVERGVRFVQLFDWGWDSHGTAATEALNSGFKQKCADIDKPIAALLTDLKQRGLLEDTLVVFAGEFGRTPMRENRGGKEMAFIGRDHHPDAFTIWMAGGGVKAGYSHGETDPIGFCSVTESVHVRDFHATVLHLLGLDHKKLTFPFQGLNQKLTSVQPAHVVHDVIA